MPFDIFACRCCHDMNILLWRMPNLAFSGTRSPHGIHASWHPFRFPLSYFAVGDSVRLGGGHRVVIDTKNMSNSMYQYQPNCMFLVNWKSCAVESAQMAWTRPWVTFNSMKLIWPSYPDHQFYPMQHSFPGFHYPTMWCVILWKNVEPQSTVDRKLEKMWAWQRKRE